MKIAIVTDSYHPTRDGVVASIDTVNGIRSDHGVDTDIVAPDPGNDDERIDGVHYFRSVSFKSYPGYFIPIYPSHAKRVLRDISPDVVHIQGVAVMALKGIVAAHKLGIPVVMTFHTMVGDTVKYYSPIRIPPRLADKLVWKYIGYLTRWVDAIVAPSESTKRELIERGVKVSDIRVIPTPIDGNRFRPDVDGFVIRERFGLQDKRIVLSLCRVSFEKNIDMLVRAMKGLDDDVVLLIVGKGPATDSLRALSEELNISDRVIFAGFAPDEEVVMYYTASDVFAVASRFETQCLSAIEAMSCGLPVVCARARALEDYVVDGQNGYLFDDDVDDCIEKLRLGLKADDVMRSKAKETASDFSVPRFMERMSSLYDDVIAAKKGEKDDR